MFLCYIHLEAVASVASLIATAAIAAITAVLDTNFLFFFKD
jgi:hypothetical protein